MKKLRQPIKLEIKQGADRVALKINDVPLESIVSSYELKLEHEAGCLPILNIRVPVPEAIIELEKCEVEIEEYSGI